MKTRLFKRLIAELREHCNNAVPWDLTFRPTGKLTKEQVKILEDAMKDAFELWRDNWIMPWITALENVVLNGKNFKTHRQALDGSTIDKAEGK